MSRFWHKPLTLAASLAVVAGMVGFGTATAGAVGAKSAVRHAGSGQLIFSDYEGPKTANPIQLTVVVELAMDNEILPFGQTPIYTQKVKLQPGFFTSVPSSGSCSHTCSTSLRSGIRWSTGQKLTPADLIFGWKIYMNLGICSGFCDDIKSISTKGNRITFHLHSPSAIFWPADTPPFLPHFWKRLGSAKQLKACLNAKGPNADFGFGACAPVANAIASNTALNYHDSSFPTLGPYQIASWGPPVHFVPMKYWRNSWVGGCCVKGDSKGPARLANLYFQNYPTQEGMIAAAATKATDITSDYTLANVKTLQKLNKGAYKIAVPGTYNPEMLFFNTYNNPVDVWQTPGNSSSDSIYKGNNPVTSSKVRLALAMSYSRSGLIQFAYKAPKSVANKLLSYSVPVMNDKSAPRDPWADQAITGAWDPLRHAYVAGGSKQAIKDAKKLIKQAGYAHGVTIYLTTNSAGNSARNAEQLYLQRAWKAIGVNTKLVDVEEASQSCPTCSYLNSWSSSGTVAHGHYEVAIYEEAGSVPQPDTWQNNVISAKCAQIDAAKGQSGLDNDQNWSCIRNGTINHDFAVATKSSNNSLRMKLYKQFQTEMVKNAYWVTLTMKPNIETYDHKAMNVLPSAFSSGTPNWDSWDWAAR